MTSSSGPTNGVCRLPSSGTDSEHGEQAKSDIRRAAADFQTLNRHRPAPRGRFRDTVTSDRSAHLALVTITGTVEHFSRVTLLSLGANENAIRDWDGQTKVWSANGVELATACPSYAAMRGFYEARTAIVHQQGHLTTAQLAPKRYPKVLALLNAARIERLHHQLILDASQIQRCAHTCWQFVDELEKANKTPSA